MRNRIPQIRELDGIIKQFTKLFGARFVADAENNKNNNVSPAILALLDIRIPSFDTIVRTLQDIASEYSVNWVPNLINDEPVPSANALGSVVDFGPTSPQTLAAIGATTDVAAVLPPLGVPSHSAPGFPSAP
uniref:IST1 homolog n=1 Tax=Lygus hesperus TaxID=30085 RepID=A0A0A9YNB7_LYGHE